VPIFRNHASGPAGGVRRLVLTWLALAAVGAGIVHLALAWAVAVRFSGGLPVAGGVLAGALALVGSVELVWGLVGLLIDRVAVPGFARWVALAPVAGWALVLVSGASAGALALPFLPMGAATVFDLFIAGVLSVRLRSGRREASRQPGGDRRSWRGVVLVGLVAAGLAVSALVAPALSVTASWSQQSPATQVITPEHGSH
jgi:hypothetical protein